MEKFSKTHTESHELEEIQSSIKRVTDPIVDREILDGRLVTGVLLSSSAPVFIDHGLGRDPNWTLVKINAGVNVWDDQTNNAAARKTLKLNASGNVTVNLWIF